MPWSRSSPVKLGAAAHPPARPWSSGTGTRPSRRVTFARRRGPSRRRHGGARRGLVDVALAMRNGREASLGSRGRRVGPTRRRGPAWCALPTWSSRIRQPSACRARGRCETACPGSSGADRSRYGRFVSGSCRRAQPLLAQAFLHPVLGEEPRDLPYALPTGLLGPVFRTAGGPARGRLFSGASNRTDLARHGTSLSLLISPGPYGASWPAGVGGRRGCCSIRARRSRSASSRCSPASRKPPGGGTFRTAR
jgi:hypothetical protein